MTQTKWVLHVKKTDFSKIAENFRIGPVAARIIRSRGIEDMESVRHYLHSSIEDLYDPRLLPDMEKAVDILRREAAKGKTIRIVGDHDIDEMCSTYLLYRVSKRIGAKVDYETPDRVKDGYGTNEMVIETTASDGIDTIPTCDNGIAAVSQVARVEKLGVTVIVTDHYDILVEENEEDLPEGGREVLPPTDAIVSPKLGGCACPFTGICGEMMASKLVQVLFKEPGILAREWLGMLKITATVTVGDMMRLRRGDRIIVEGGLRCLGHTSNLGLKRLIEKNNLVPGSITAYHIGFMIDPCLNTNGRLQTVKIALSLSLHEDEEEANRMATELRELNDQGKDVTQAGVGQAAAMVEERYGDDKVLVVFLPDCHKSLAGIMAGRLRERYNKPSLMLTRTEDCAKGSGRSIEAYHMSHALVEMRDLLLKFGGHPMAAGFSLEGKDVDEFRGRLNGNARKRLTKEDFTPRMWIDVTMPFEYVTEPFVRGLELLKPYRQGNEKPQFAQKSMVVRSVHVMGQNWNMVRLSLVNEWGVSMDGVIFTDGDLFIEEKGNSRLMDVIYYPDINEYNGNRDLQIVAEDWKFH